MPGPFRELYTMEAAMPPVLLALAVFALLLGGMVKGLVGVGLPLVVVSLLASFLDPKFALALVAVPVVVTNVWQSLRAGLALPAAKRFWPLMLPFVVGTWGGAQIVAAVDTRLLLGVLGIVVIGFSSMSLLRPRSHLSRRQEAVAGPCVGLAAGVLNGVSTVNGPPLVMYLVSLGLKKNEFVGAYALIALSGAVPLLLSYIAVGLLGPREFGFSVLALLPALLGLVCGERLRRRIDAERFRQLLLWVLILLGINLIRRAIW
jgi:uncharacterized membrane protein YfcA